MQLLLPVQVIMAASIVMLNPSIHCWGKPMSFKMAPPGFLLSRLEKFLHKEIYILCLFFSNKIVCE